MDRNIRDLIKRVEAIEAWRNDMMNLDLWKKATHAIEDPLPKMDYAAFGEVDEITKDMSADPSAYRAQHQGRGWWVVLGSDGMKVHTGSMRKEQAEQMVREYSERAAA